MIPTIADIVAGLLSGAYTPEQAVNWLKEHVHLASNDDGLRDHFAGQAMLGAISNCENHSIANHDELAVFCYRAADAMLTHRNKANRSDSATPREW